MTKEGFPFFSKKPSLRPCPCLKWPKELVQPITEKQALEELKASHELWDLIREVNPISDRHFNVHKDNQKAMKCYQDEMDERKTCKQTDIGIFFKKL